MSDALFRFIPEFLAACRVEPEERQGSLSARLLVDTFETPPVPVVVQIDALNIQAVQLYLWCRLALKHVDALPEALKVAVALDRDSAACKAAER